MRQRSPASEFSELYVDFEKDLAPCAYEAQKGVAETARTLGDVARAKRMPQAVKYVGLSRESLCRALSVYGNPGLHRNLTEGVSELKVDIGPEYRVYYSQRGASLMLLIAGGDKSSQTKDIALALELNRNFTEKQK